MLVNSGKMSGMGGVFTSVRRHGATKLHRIKGIIKMMFKMA